MLFTRRQVIRDMTFASTAAVLNPLKGCHGKTHRAPAGWDTSGTRIVFGGAWIFCAHPAGKPGFMYAVSVNMPTEPHHFPYGTWNERTLKEWIDDTKTKELPSGSMVATVALQQQGNPWQPTTLDVNMLFQQTHNNGPFTEIAKMGTPHPTDWKDPNLRVIELPIPSRILPTTIRTDATLTCSSVYCKPNQIAGLAFTHIFVYDGADILTFSPMKGAVVNGSTSTSSDLLIFTIPCANFGTGHATEMFKALLTAVNPDLATNLTLTVPKMTDPPRPGPAIPAGVSAEEQGNVIDRGDFATCGSIAVALDN